MMLGERPLEGATATLSHVHTFCFFLPRLYVNVKEKVFCNL